MWVADENGDSISVLDADTNAVTTTLTGLKTPHNVQVSRDGSAVLAVSAGTDTVLAIDATALTVRAFTATGASPEHVVEAPNGKIYVTNAGDGTVSVYRGLQLQPAGRIELGGMPHGLRPASGGSVLVVANTMSGALDLIDPTTDRVSGTVPVGEGPVQVAVTADGRYAYAGIADPASVVKVNLGSRRVIGSTPVSASPVQLYLTPDESTVVSADQGTEQEPGHTLSVIDTAAMTIRGTVDTGSGPHGVVIDNSGERAWVTDTYDDTVTVVDMQRLSVVAKVSVGRQPSGITYSPRRPTSPAATVTLDIPQPTAGQQSTPPHGH